MNEYLDLCSHVNAIEEDTGQKKENKEKNSR
jgi:hypothetical protein